MVHIKDFCVLTGLFFIGLASRYRMAETMVAIGETILLKIKLDEELKNKKNKRK